MPAIVAAPGPACTVLNSGPRGNPRGLGPRCPACGGPGSPRLLAFPRLSQWRGQKKASGRALKVPGPPPRGRSPRSPEGMPRRRRCCTSGRNDGSVFQSLRFTFTPVLMFPAPQQPSGGDAPPARGAPTLRLALYGPGPGSRLSDPMGRAS